MNIKLCKVIERRSKVFLFARGKHY